MCAMLPWTIYMLAISGMIQAVDPSLDVMSLAKAQIPLKTAVFLIACLIYLVIGLAML